MVSLPDTCLQCGAPTPEGLVWCDACTEVAELVGAEFAEIISLDARDREMERSAAEAR